MIPSTDTQTDTPLTTSPPKRLTITCGHVGQWILFVGPKSIQHMMIQVIGELAENEEVRVVDGGNCLTDFPRTKVNETRACLKIELEILLRKNPEALERIRTFQVRSCQQMLAVLENMPAIPEPFVVLDLLNTFYDGSVKIGERKKLLQGCLENLERLGDSLVPASQVQACRLPADPQGRFADGNLPAPVPPRPIRQDRQAQVRSPRLVVLDDLFAAARQHAARSHRLRACLRQYRPGLSGQDRQVQVWIPALALMTCPGWKDR